MADREEGAEGTMFKCKKHGTVSCDKCFDWATFILKSLEMLERLRNARKRREGAQEAAAKNTRKPSLDDLD